VIYVQFECIIVELDRKRKHIKGKYNIVLWKFWRDQYNVCRTKKDGRLKEYKMQFALYMFN
jgi:hypothetical protein